MLGEKVPDAKVKVFKFGSEGLIGMMDGSGSNLEKVKQWVKLLVTSDPGSRARERAEEWNVPLVEMDFRKFEDSRGIEKGDYLKAVQGRSTRSGKPAEEVIEVRQEACRELKSAILNALQENDLPELPVFAAGFMALLSKEFVESFFILNIHPGDLTKVDKDGKRILTGGAWRPSARALRERYGVLYSSMHLMTPDMDAGPVLMRGYPLKIDYGKLEQKIDFRDPKDLERAAKAAQESLKRMGDHVVGGACFLDLFRGNWGWHTSETLAYKFKNEWYLAPDGITIQDHLDNNPETKYRKKDLEIRKITEELYNSL